MLRAIECVEFAASLPQIVCGRVLEVSAGVECKTMRSPVGVVAGITPFNFPFMVPLWMVPMAIGLGNSFVLKPSEQTPLSAMELARLFDAAINFSACLGQCKVQCVLLRHQRRLIRQKL